MTERTGTIGQPSVPLRGYLSARMLPLTLLLLVLVSVSAPLAYFSLAARGLRAQAQATAVQVADAVVREVQERPVLWRYDAGQLLTHLRAYAENASAARIEVVDRTGVRIPLGDAPIVGTGAGDGPLLWASAPLLLNEEIVGRAYVAVGLGEARAAALLLLLPFGLLGVGLAGLLYFLPVRAIARAERHIAQGQAALAEFTQTLEQQVAERSSQLRDAYEQLRLKEQRLRELSTNAVLLQEAERRVIARELHDSAGQALTAIRINLQLIAHLASAESGPDGKVARLAGKTLTLADATLEEIRRAVSMLGPAILDDVGLVPAIERLCDDFGEPDSVTITSDLDVPDEGLSPALESVCYRVAQEALTNVARHARASEVHVRLQVEPARIVLEVRDNGRGFVPGERGESSGGRGLVGMRERVELLGGALRIDSAPGVGTTVRVELPRRALSEDGDDSAVVVA